MASSQLYVLAALLAFLAIALVLSLKKGKPKKSKPISRLTSVAFALIVAGIVFGENRLLGYGLMGAGAALAIFETWRNMRGKGG